MESKYIVSGERAATRVGPVREERDGRRASEAAEVLGAFPSTHSVGLGRGGVAVLRVDGRGGSQEAVVVAAASYLLDDVRRRHERERLGARLQLLELFDLSDQDADLPLDHVDLDFLLREQLVSLRDLLLELELHVEESLSLQGQSLDVRLEVQDLVRLVVRLDDSGHSRLLPHVLALHLQLVHFHRLRLSQLFLLFRERFEETDFLRLL